MSTSNEVEATRGEVLPPENSNGHHPRYATADEILLGAPKDIIEKDITDVFGGLTIRIRALTAAQSAHVKQVSLNIKGNAPEVAWASMERMQFELGVVEPKMTSQQILVLHRTSGPSFAKIINELDQISGIAKDELREAQREFQES